VVKQLRSSQNAINDWALDPERSLC
jgi:hypothetical protein